MEKQELGRIEISDDVIRTIAGIAVSEITGIAGMRGSFIDGIKQATTGKKEFSAGVEVRRENEAFIIDLDIIIDYDVKISDVSVKAQKIVKEKVEAITGKAVGAVNVHVADIRLPGEFSEPEGEES
ncbi:MAG TPA: Asp23/Gls24 family envelope stress response protein [bacterium]|nr:Asp23/Gls24 family envelope stress response protein [bacterium]